MWLILGRAYFKWIDQIEPTLVKIVETMDQIVPTRVKMAGKI